MPNTRRKPGKPRNNRPRWEERKKKLEKLKKPALIIWEVIAMLAVLGIVALFVIELAVDLTPKQDHYFLVTDIVLLCLLALDLVILYVRAESKKVFFKKNWWMILALTPFTWFLRPLRLLRSVRFIRFLRSTRIVRFFRLEKLWERILKELNLLHAGRAAPEVAKGVRSARVAPRVKLWKEKKKTKKKRKAKGKAKKKAKKKAKGKAEGKRVLNKSKK